MMGRVRGQLGYWRWELGWLARRLHCVVAGHVWTPSVDMRTLRCDDCGTVRGMDHA